LSRPYQPINCEFHDVLEAVATGGRRVPIVHATAGAAPAVVVARITDLGARDAVEYMHLDDGSQIRLDDIVSVDGIDQQAFDPR
jgi:Rho-binding antiterminator